MSPHRLDFEDLYRYDRGKDGIILTVTLSYGKQRVVLDAKLDTAATFCVVARSYGEGLGLNVESGIEQAFGTALGTFTAYGHPVDVQTLGFRFESYVFFAAEPWLTRNVLGRRGWLDMFRVGIVDYPGELYLSLYEH